MAYPIPVLVQASSSFNSSSSWDGVIFISDTHSSSNHENIVSTIAEHSSIDQRVGKQALLLAAPNLAGGRLVYSPTGPLNRDYDDVRRVADAARHSAEIAAQSGMQRPLLLIELSTDDSRYSFSIEVAYLAFCQALWQPLEARQSLSESVVETVKEVGLYCSKELNVEWLSAVECGKRLARDLCGTEPERMAPPGFANYCEEAFAGTAVKVSVIADNQQILKDYPLLHAVARASVEVKRHAPRVIRLVYEGSGEITRTIFLAGKGITFDTGGADLKVGGHMAGMSRDKGGAAAVAGFLKTVALLNPMGIRVVAEIGAVRNSIGADAFVPDEIVTGHSGKRVRVGNTDAEGRMVLADLLSHLRLEAQQSVNPEMFSVATLTGHAAIAFGPYTALVENGPAIEATIAASWCSIGDLWGDPAEQSRSRREDFDFIRPRTKADDLLSSNNGPSATTARGHQFPMAFLTMASGLEQHDASSDNPIPFTHVDIAGSGVENGDWQHGKPTAAPVAAMAAKYLLNISNGH
jgi:leucyl aminopeptidase